MKMVKQTWENCKHGFPGHSLKDETERELRKYGLHLSYCCGNNEIIKLGTYPTVLNEGEDDSRNVACLKEFGLIKVSGGRPAEYIFNEAKKALAGCTRCRFHEEKK